MTTPCQDTIESHFAAGLTAAMKAYQIVDVARMTGVPYGVVEQIKNGRRLPTYRQLARLVRMFPELAALLQTAPI